MQIYCGLSKQFIFDKIGYISFVVELKIDLVNQQTIGGLRKFFIAPLRARKNNSYFCSNRWKSDNFMEKKRKNFK